MRDTVSTGQMRCGSGRLNTGVAVLCGETVGVSPVGSQSLVRLPVLPHDVLDPTNKRGETRWDQILIVVPLSAVPRQLGTVATVFTASTRSR